LYPYLSYRDAATALHVLKEAFAFTVSLRWDNPDGTVQHTEAALGEGAVMMGTAEHPPAPLEGSSVGQGITQWETRRYRVLYPEGYEWSFGDYRPGAVAGTW
jgi:uncharacterized glyoxalase superfamily protein PhnB